MLPLQGWNAALRPIVLGTAVATAPAGCFTEPSPILAESDESRGGEETAVSEISGDDSGAETTTTSTGTSTGSETLSTEETTSPGGEILGDAFQPLITKPSPDQTLAPTRSLLFWTDGIVPEGRTVTGYELCWTTGRLGDIDGDEECPNATPIETTFHVLEPLAAGTTYAFKVRTLYDEGFFSGYSDVRPFQTNALLLGWWRMDGNASDASGVGNDGILQNGAGFTEGIAVQSLGCDGIDDYANLGNDPSLDAPGPLSISAWVYTDEAALSADTGIINKGDLRYALTYNTDGDIWFYIGQGNNFLHAPLSPGAWHHVAGTFDGTTEEGGMKLYVDGNLVDSRASLFDATGAVGSLWIGRYDTQYFKGRIDDVTLHAAALAMEDVGNEFCSVKGLTDTNPLPDVCLP
ncbi:MAG TPA: LamG-like jellyroll fold domain-containing protein [bacterium]|nr:LamG-like jellyroll fold domain-containing protein [bacterium]